MTQFKAHLPGYGTGKAPAGAPPSAQDQAGIADQRLKDMWGAQRFHGPAPGKQTGSLAWDDQRNARLPLPAKPGAGWSIGASGGPQTGPALVPRYLDPGLLGLPTGGGGGPLLSNPGVDEPGGHYTPEDAKKHAEVQGPLGRFLGFSSIFSSDSNGGSGGGGNGNTSNDEQGYDYSQDQVGMGNQIVDYWATVTSLDPCVQYVPPTNVLASRQFYHNYPALSPANLAGTAAEIGFGLATGPVVDSVIIGGAEGLLGAGAALYAGAAVGGVKFGPWADDAVRTYKEAEALRNVTGGGAAKLGVSTNNLAIGNLVFGAKSPGKLEQHLGDFGIRIGKGELTKEEGLEQLRNTVRNIVRSSSDTRFGTWREQGDALFYSYDNHVVVTHANTGKFWTVLYDAVGKNAWFMKAGRL